MTDSSTSFAVQLMSQQGLSLQEMRPAFNAWFVLPVSAQYKYLRHILTLSYLL
jgi:hypothetical protein